MTRIYLSGGLGNNLFQIFLASILERDGKEIIFANNLLTKNFVTKFLNWTIHENQLDKLNIKTKKVKPLIFCMDMVCLFISKVFKIKIFGHIHDSNNLYNFNYEEVIDYFYKAKVMSGYFQYPILINEKNIELLRIRLEINSIKKCDNAIHLRGGDLLHINKKLLEYYSKCIVELGSDKQFTLITNDKEFRDALVLKNEQINLTNFEGKDPISDFMFMVNTSNLICSYSTFSLWAGLLGNQDKVYIPLFENDNFFSKKSMPNLPKRFILTP